jgi:hypothetical protein
MFLTGRMNQGDHLIRIMTVMIIGIIGLLMNGMTQDSRGI